MTDPAVTYSAQHMAEAESTGLAPEYFAARDAAAEFLKHWKQEHAEQVCGPIVKHVTDEITEKVWDAFRDWFVDDGEGNVRIKINEMVESTVNALLGGEQWAIDKYLTGSGWHCEQTRKTLAALHSDAIKDARIADLERQLELEREIRRF